MPTKKLLVCDVEGTIFKAENRLPGVEYAATMWQELARELGKEAIKEELETHKKWKNGDYNGNYLAWVEDSYQIHKKHGLTKNIFERVLTQAKYVDGVVGFFETLDKEKYIPVFISGGFVELIEKAKKDLYVDHYHGACKYFFDPDNGKLVDKSLTPCDFEGKYFYVSVLLEQLHLDKEKDWVFVGDGKNDIDIAKRAPVAFAIGKAHDGLRKIVGDNNCVENFFQLKKRFAQLDEKQFADKKKNSAQKPETPKIPITPRGYVATGFDIMRPSLIDFIYKNISQNKSDWWTYYIKRQLEKEQKNNDKIEVPESGMYDTLFAILDDARCIKLIKYNWNIFKNELSVEINILNELLEIRNEQLAHITGLGLQMNVARKALSNMADLMLAIDTSTSFSLTLLQKQMFMELAPSNHFS